MMKTVWKMLIETENTKCSLRTYLNSDRFTTSYHSSYYYTNIGNIKEKGSKRLESTSPALSTTELSL